MPNNPLLPCTEVIHELTAQNSGDYFLHVVAVEPLEPLQCLEVWRGGNIICGGSLQSIALLLLHVQEGESIRLMANYPATFSQWGIRKL